MTETKSHRWGSAVWNHWTGGIVCARTCVGGRGLGGLAGLWGGGLAMSIYIFLKVKRFVQCHPGGETWARSRPDLFLLFVFFFLSFSLVFFLFGFCFACFCFVVFLRCNVTTGRNLMRGISFVLFFFVLLFFFPSWENSETQRAGGTGGRVNSVICFKILQTPPPPPSSHPQKISLCIQEDFKSWNKMLYTQKKKSMYLFLFYCLLHLQVETSDFCFCCF